MVKANIICDGFLFSSFEDCVTSSFIPIKPFNDIKEHQPTVEVEEFVQESTKYSRPYRVYKNQIYIYPKHLKYDSQKYFNKVQSVTSPGRHWVVMCSMSSHWNEGVLIIKEGKRVMQVTDLAFDLFQFLQSYNIDTILMSWIYGLILSCISDSKRDNVVMAFWQISEGLYFDEIMCADKINLGNICSSQMKLEYYLHFHGDWKLMKNKTQVSAGDFIICFYTVSLRPGLHFASSPWKYCF